MDDKRSSGAPVPLQIRLQAACSGIEAKNRVTLSESNEENMDFAPRDRYVSPFFGMSAFEKVMDE